jgi:hypothetical protein
MTLAFAQILHLGNARSVGPVLTLGRATANPHALAAVVVAVGLQLGALFIAPVADVLRLTWLTGDDWLVVVVFSVLPAAIGQAIKLVRRRS